jgi:flagellar basal-body rod protein FlgF
VARVENTFLVGLSQQVASHRAMDVIANNLANLATPAFKRESVQFEQFVVPVPASEAEGSGTVNVSFVLDRGEVRDLTDGRLETTGAPFDVALTGPGYFVVQAPEGERYTRNGHFRLDETGRLATEEGYAVQGEGGDIVLQPEDGPVSIGADGTISTRLTQLGKLRVVNFANERALKKAGSSLFTAENETPVAVERARVHQGMIEKSNVEPVLEISRMIQVMRAYQATSDLTQTSQELLKRAIEKLGAVPQG